MDDDNGDGVGSLRTSRMFNLCGMCIFEFLLQTQRGRRERSSNPCKEGVRRGENLGQTRGTFKGSNVGVRGLISLGNYNAHPRLELL